MAAKEGKASDKNSEMNDFAEFEREDDDDVDDSYEDEIQNEPAERNMKAEEFDDNEADIETGTFYSKAIISLKLYSKCLFLQNWPNCNISKEIIELCCHDLSIFSNLPCFPVIPCCSETVKALFMVC